MKYYFFLVCVLVCLLKTNAQNIERAKTTIATLSAKEMHGRSAAFQGDKKAAAFIQQQFSAAGLSPLGNHYIQPFRYNTQVFTGKAALSINNKKLLPGVDFIIDPVSASGKGKATLLFLDSTFFYAENNQQVYSREFFKNKAVIYDQKYYQQLTELPLSTVQAIYSAACIIEYNHPKLTMSMASEPLGIPIYHLGKMDPTELKNGTCKFELQSTWIQNYESQNVIGFIKGQEQPDSFILFTAHYDHLGHLGKKTFFPGANDNASGVAMLTELAYHYGKEGSPYSIVFIAFGAEESGLIGSKYFTQHPLIELKHIKFLINMDIFGTGEESITVVNGTEHLVAFNKLDSLNRIHAFTPQVNKRGKAANSDHYYFSQKGVPAFFIYTNGKAKAYHDVYDVPENLSLEKFGGLFRLLTLFVKEL